MERSALTPSHRSSAARIFEEIGVLPQADNLFHQATERMLRAAEMVGLRHHQQIILAQPKSEVMVHFPVQMDDGRHRLFKGYRVQHNDALGPYLGGIRFHPRLSLDTVKGLAVLSTLRASLVRVPLGGAFGGVRCAPTEMSEDERRRVVRRFCSAISHQIGPAHDIVAPESGADSQTMAWFLDTLAQTTPEPSRQDQSRAVVGKPGELGGLMPRGRAAALSVVATLDTLLSDVDLASDGMRVSIMGFGAVGSAVARALAARGCPIVSVLTQSGALANAQGLDPVALQAHHARTGGVEGFDGGQTCTEEEFWQIESEVLIVASPERSMDEVRAAKVQARVVVEAGLACTTPAAEDILMQRCIDLFPDILCSSGSDVAHFLEWNGLRSQPGIRREEVEEHVLRQALFAARRVRVARMKHECDWRVAAQCAALERIARVYELRGVFP